MVQRHHTDRPADTVLEHSSSFSKHPRCTFLSVVCRLETVSLAQLLPRYLHEQVVLHSFSHEEVLQQHPLQYHNQLRLDRPLSYVPMVDSTVTIVGCIGSWSSTCSPSTSDTFVALFIIISWYCSTEYMCLLDAEQPATYEQNCSIESRDV